MSPDRSMPAPAILLALVASSLTLSAVAAAQTPPGVMPPTTPASPPAPHTAPGPASPPAARPAPPPKAASSAAPAEPAKPGEVQPAPEAGAANIGAPAANAISSNPVAQKGKIDTGGTVFAHLGLGAAYEKPGIALMGGGKLQLSTGWMVGLDAEWNPWFSFDTRTFRKGVLNIYASLIRRYQMRYEAVNLRTTVAAGASTLLFDLYGARSGSVGPYVGLSPLGIEWKMADRWYLVVDPANIAFPIPHISGVPLGYLQYRATIGLEIELF